MRKALVAGGAALVVAGVGLMQVFGASAYRLAAVAPANTTVWLEVRDLEGTLGAFRQSGAFKDYERSSSKEQVDQAWEQLLKLNDAEAMAEWKKLGLPLSEESLLLGLGEFVGLGAIATPDGPPSAFVATKLDLLGIAKKVATDGEWSKAWEGVRKALGGPRATLETYQGYDLVSRYVEGQEVHFSLLRDVLVASIDKDTIKALIDVQAGKRESLGKSKTFRAELDGIADDHAAYAYVDMTSVRDPKRLVETVKRVADRLGMSRQVEKFDGEELSVLQQDLREDVDALAFGLYLPKGDVYGARVEVSRAEDELFRDCARHDLRELLGEDTFAYVEARGLYDLVRRVGDSEAARAFRDAQATRWLREKLEKPEELPDALKAQAPVRLKGDPTFEARLGLTLASFPLQEVLGNDVALAIEAHEGKTPEEALRPLAFVRTRPVVRLAADVITGFLAKQDKATDGPFEAVAHGQRTIYAFKGPKAPLYWTQVGAELALSTRRELLERVIDRAGATGAPTEFQKAVKRLPEGYALFAYLDMDKYQKLMKTFGLQAELGKLEPFLKGVGAQAWAAYVDEGCTTYTLRSWAQLGEELDPALRKLYAGGQDAEPAAWARLPEESFYSIVGDTDPDAAWDYCTRLGKAMGGEKQVDDLLAMVSKEFLGGQDVRATLVQPLGGDAGFALVTQPKLGEGPELVAVPAAVVALELDDAAAAATFEKGLEALLEAGLKAANARALAEDGDEGHARRTLMQLRAAQGLFRDADLDGDGVEDYADLEELAATGHVDPSLVGGVSQGWVFEVRSSKFDWIATARRADAGDDAITFVVNHGSDEVMEVQGPVAHDSFALPEGAVPFGTLPRAAVELAPDDPRLLRLEKVQLGGVAATRLVMPEEKAQQAKAVVGGGLGPCYAFADGWLFVATSEHALQEAVAARKEQGSLAASASFRKLIAGHPTKAQAYQHWSWAGIATQLGDNGELLARQLAPLPKELALPPRPEFPEPAEGQDFKVVFEKYKQDVDAWEKASADHHVKAAAWRKEHAAENAKAMMGPVRELFGLLGGMVSYATVDQDGKGMESVLEVRLDPSAVKGN